MLNLQFLSSTSCSITNYFKWVQALLATTACALTGSHQIHLGRLNLDVDMRTSNIIGVLYVLTVENVITPENAMGSADAKTRKEQGHNSLTKHNTTVIRDEEC